MLKYKYLFYISWVPKKTLKIYSHMLLPSNIKYQGSRMSFGFNKGLGCIMCLEIEKEALNPEG